MSRLVGAHVDPSDPLQAARERGSGILQMFLSNPQGWKAPEPRNDAAELRDASVSLIVHSPYLINVCAGNNRIRIPSRKILNDTLQAADAISADAVVVHGGHVSDDEDPKEGFVRWKKALDQVESDMPIFIENTASGDRAVGREVDMIARLWDVVGDTGVGFCLDTCHAWAAGEPLDGLVERIMDATGRIDLLHCNGSRDPFNSRRDRHDNLLQGHIPVDQIAEIVRKTTCPVILETPGGASDHVDEINLVRSYTEGI